MRLLHTSDWHLGHRLHGFDRSAEHAHFLRWLQDRLEEYAIDVLLIAGDVFDTANPPASALAQWYRFVATCCQRLPGLQIVVIGGNHDSAARLDAPSPLLDALAVAVRGGRVRHGEELAAEDLVVPVSSRDRSQRGWVAAVPFLRPCDLPACKSEPSDDPLIAGVAELYRQVGVAIAQRRQSDDLVIAMGHLYLAGTALSELSERRILGGNQHALPASIFPSDCDYVALGHLHRAQAIGSDHVRYSGSPLPLALDERDYRHQVVVVDLPCPGKRTITVVPTPRLLALPRVPAQGAVAVNETLAGLAALPVLQPHEGLLGGGIAALLEVAVAIDHPEPRLRAQVEAAILGKGYQLARLSVHGKGSADSHLAAQNQVPLAELTPQQVLNFLWHREYGSEPPSPVEQAFAELIEAVHQEGGR